MEIRKFFSSLVLCVMIVSFLGITVNSQSMYIWTDESRLDILDKYSDSLSGDITVQSEYWSRLISLEITERRQFYSDYFNLGLHSDLTNIKAEFDHAAITKAGENVINVVESVTLSGVPILKNAEDYPIYQATLLAEKQVEDIRKSLYLESNARDILRAVKESIFQGEFKFTIINLHTIEFDPNSNNINKDEFTSRAKDDPGIDTVIWDKEKPVRIHPNYAVMQDNLIYTLGIEELAKIILDDVNRIPESSSAIGPRNQIQYSDSNAAAYMRTYVRVNRIDCDGVYQDRSAYNDDYENDQFGGCGQMCECLDCVNYVSQALVYAGKIKTSTWQPYVSAWVGVQAFENKMISSGYGYYRDCAIVQLGDIGIIPQQHTGMVTAINPLRYSGHTNDRLNYPWTSSYTRCINIY